MSFIKKSFIREINKQILKEPKDKESNEYINYCAKIISLNAEVGNKVSDLEILITKLSVLESKLTKIRKEVEVAKERLNSTLTKKDVSKKIKESLVKQSKILIEKYKVYSQRFNKKIEEHNKFTKKWGKLKDLKKLEKKLDEKLRSLI